MKLIIRTDANWEIGSGHLMRMIALAQAWKTFIGSVTFVVGNDCPDVLLKRVEAEGFCVLNDKIIPESDVLIFDGYQFAEIIENIELKMKPVVVCVDDFVHLSKYPVHFVINQNLYASPALYKKTPVEGMLLTGSDFVMLRSEFIRNPRPEPRDLPYENILVSIGGSDPAGLSSKVLRALNGVTSLRLNIRLISAVGFQDFNIQSFAKESEHLVSIIEGSDDMYSLYAWADFVVTAAGSSLWECLYMRVPFAFFCVAENQELNAKSLRDKGIGLFLDQNSDWARDLCQLLQFQDTATAMQSRNQEVDIDGYGRQRICSHLAALPFWIRPGNRSDCRWLWNLANDKALRDVSFSGKPIEWESHQRWFEKLLTEQDRHILIAIDLDTEKRIGYVRFHEDEKCRTVVSIAIIDEFRGNSLAGPMIQLAERFLRSTFSFEDDLYAWIKPDNIASRKTFERCGYSVIERAPEGENALCFIKRK